MYARNTVRTPLALYVLAFLVRAALVVLFPGPAYPDSFYYVDVARSIAAGHGLTVDFVWIFAEVGNHIPDPAVLPIASNAHWLPLASFIQAPFVTVLGPTALASALPGLLIGSLAAPLTWFIARDGGFRPLVATAAGVIVAVPGTATIFMAQPETFPISMVLVPLTLWLVARGLRGDGRAFVLAGLTTGLMALARNDGVLLGGALALVWLLDRLRAWRSRHGRRSWSHVADRAAIPVLAAALALAAFLVVIGPWWLRQLGTFGSISPTSSSGAALWIRNIDEWNSITANPSLDAFLAQGPLAILASRVDGLTAAVSIFTVLICSVVLLPFLLLGMLARRHSIDVQPWFVYTLVVFAGATLLYPVHVPGGTFIHTAIGLLPQAAILSVEGLLVVVRVIAGRRRNWEEGSAGTILTWGVVAIVVTTGVVFGSSALDQWEARADQRAQLSDALTRLNVPVSDRLMSIDAAGMKYATGHPGVVTTNDPLSTIQAIATAYDIRWLVLERADIGNGLHGVFEGARPPWIGPPAFTVPSSDGGLPRLQLYPVCVGPGDSRCSAG
jgi:hypothetical protein